MPTFFLVLHLVILSVVYIQAKPIYPAMRALKKHRGKGGGVGGGSDKTIAFERQVLVTILGLAEDTTAAEMDALTHAFVSSYNALTASTSTSRNVNSVTAIKSISDDLDTRLPQGTTSPPSLSGLLFRINGQCKRCKNNLNLFTNNTSRRLQTVTHKEQPHHHRYLAKGESSSNYKRILRMNKVTGGGGSGSNKLCTQCEPPSNAVFTNLYNTEIQRLHSSGVIQSVDSIEKVTELTAVPCPADFSEFESNVLIQLTGYPDNATDDQLTSLEQGFLQTYNNLNLMNNKTCDVTFKEIVKVDIHTDASLQVARSLMHQTASPPEQRALKKAPIQFTYTFRVTGRCRGCPAGNKLFNDAVRRALSAHINIPKPRHLQQLSTGVDQCFCPINSILQSPSAADFQMAFDSTIDILTAAGTVTFIDEIVDLAELERVDCPANTIGFESFVLYSFNGNADNATSDQLDALGQAFLISYNTANALNPVTCDPEFRVVTDVDIIIESSSSRRALATRVLGSITSLRPTFSYRFRVNGSCRGCSRSSNLFNDAVRRSLVSSPSSSKRLSPPTRSLLLNTNSSDATGCVCPVNADIRAPFIEEFANIFETRIANLQEDGTLSFVDGIAEQPIEVDPAVCDTSENTFANEVILPLFGNPDLISEAETRSLAEGFLMTYNSLTQGSFCDPLFRTVVDVVIGGVVSQSQSVTTSTAGLRHLQSSRAVPVARKFGYKIYVTGRCRGCASNSKLFNDAVRRRSLAIISSRERTMQMITVDECFCPSNFVDDRAPSADEFSVVFNQTLALLELPNIKSIDGFVEESGTNFSFPTQAPTSSNTKEPTIFPIQTPFTISTDRPSSLTMQVPSFTQKPNSDPTQGQISDPTTQAPNIDIPSQAPTSDPTIQTPTLDPTTKTPTTDPTTKSPTINPTSQAPTIDPTTQVPTSDPTTQAPTIDTTTQAPTIDPTPQAPTSELSQSPISNSTQLPTSFPSQFLPPSMVTLTPTVTNIPSNRQLSFDPSLSSSSPPSSIL